IDHELLRLLQASRGSLADLKQLQTQLVESEKLASLGQLVGGAAHELNNPLTAMLGYADLLSSSELDSEPRLLAQRIGQQGRKTKSLVASLLSFARQAPGGKAAVDVSALVQTTVKHCQAQASLGHCILRSDLAENPLTVLGDSNQLLQVCLHIVSNALLALEESGGGTLTIATRRRNESIVIEFRELGVRSGTSREGWDPFLTARPAGQGMGLGLSACYGIIQEHNGNIFCESRQDGETVFRVELPALQPAVATRPGESREPAPGAAPPTSPKASLPQKP
ncbi:MAG TPA: HAMP domain-containing sensor histidine kinase, partial [Terriglobales bacterium]